MIDKEKQLEKLKKYTIGNVKFDSIIISDFNDLKCNYLIFIYRYLSRKKYIITFNQWFDNSLLNEETIQPIYYPSIDRQNLKNFEKNFSIIQIIQTI